MPSGHVDKTKLRPLSEHAWKILPLLLREGPQPRHTINPGVRLRLYRENLIEEAAGVRRNSLVYHVRLTDAGRAKLEELDV